MKNWVWAFGVLAVIIVFALLYFANSIGKKADALPIPTPVQSPKEATGGATNMEVPFEVLSADQIEGRQVTIKTEKGDIVLELFADAPLAASNFVSLINKKFYDGLTFHRREEGFVVQGGDSSGDGTGGPGYKFADESVTRNYDRGIVAMANSGPNTNGSQFFIMLANYPLPPQYTIFGKVISGMEVVDEIQIGDKMTSVTIK